MMTSSVSIREQFGLLEQISNAKVTTEYSWNDLKKQIIEALNIIKLIESESGTSASIQACLNLVNSRLDM